MKTLFDPDDRQELIARVEKFSENSERQFGLMRPDQALHHINEALKSNIHGATTPYHGNGLKAGLLRLFTFSPLPIPKGKAQTFKDLVSDGTYKIEHEKERFRKLVEEFASKEKVKVWPVSPIFGKLSNRQYGKLAWKHADHHIRQFGH